MLRMYGHVLLVEYMCHANIDSIMRVNIIVRLYFILIFSLALRYVPFDMIHLLCGRNHYS